MIYLLNIVFRIFSDLFFMDCWFYWFFNFFFIVFNLLLGILSLNKWTFFIMNLNFLLFFCSWIGFTVFSILFVAFIFLIFKWVFLNWNLNRRLYRAYTNSTICTIFVIGCIFGCRVVRCIFSIGFFIQTIMIFMCHIYIVLFNESFLCGWTHTWYISFTRLPW